MSLPSGYAQLAYIKSSGAQYIDTGVAAAKDLKVEAIMDVDESSAWIMILGDYTSSKYFSWWANGNLAHAYFGSKDGTLTFSAGKHTYIADGPNNKWEIDGTSITLEPASSDFSGTGGTLYLFSVHNGGSYTSASAKLYSCKIYKNGTLIRDFVPCRNASGTLGLYDITNNSFYGNAGSGDFEGPYYGPLKNSCLIDGATYQIKNGKVLIGGTKYEINTGNTLIDGTAMSIPLSSGIPLSTTTPGEILMLNESGSPVPFYIAKHDYESGLNGAGRTLVVRKDCYDSRKWHRSNVNAYASSTIDSWLNGTYKNLLDADIRGIIGTTKIKYTPGNGNYTVGTLNRAIFLLSATELHKQELGFNKEGTTLEIASSLQIAYMNGSAVYQWTRSPYTDYAYDAICLDTYGNVSSQLCTYDAGSRPAFTLPSTFPVIQNQDGTYSPAA